jgi:galactose mutarotase-like enzyme
MSASGSSDLILENDYFRIKVKQRGAELCSLFSKELNTELLWQAGHAWPKHAPVLFPIVGQLRDNLYQYDGKQYSLSRHGFARDRNFHMSEINTINVSLILSDDMETMKHFPFHFLLKVQYHLNADKVQMTITVENTGDKIMYCSYGAHPAFRVPLFEEENFESYDLQFGTDVSMIERWPLKNDLISDQPEVIKTNHGNLHLNRELFSADAIVIKNPEFNTIAIVNRETGKGVTMNFGDWPFFGIWSAPGGNFVCLEPWQGVAGTASSTGNLEEKEGILALPANGTHSSSFSLLAVHG